MNKKTTTEPATRSIHFQSGTRAQFAYEQAVQILNGCFIDGKPAVTLKGNVVTVPSWFPFSPSVN